MARCFKLRFRLQGFLLKKSLSWTHSQETVRLVFLIFCFLFFWMCRLYCYQIFGAFFTLSPRTDWCTKPKLIVLRACCFPMDSVSWIFGFIGLFHILFSFCICAFILYNFVVVFCEGVETGLCLDLFYLLLFNRFSINASLLEHYWRFQWKFMKFLRTNDFLSSLLWVFITYFYHFLWFLLGFLNVWRLLDALTFLRMFCFLKSECWLSKSVKISCCLTFFPRFQFTIFLHELALHLAHWPIYWLFLRFLH